MGTDFSLKGKVALVTGAGTGLGQGVAIGLAQAGADVVLHELNQLPEDTRKTIGDLGRRTEMVLGDMSKKDTPAKLVAFAVEKMGRLDIVVNNAGMIKRTPAVDFSDDDWDLVVEVNLNSVFRMCREAGRQMLKQGSGKIINIASLLAFQGGILVPAYAASKGGVAQVTKALANEWASKGVNVNAIAPGYMATNNTAALRADPVRSEQILTRIPANRWGTPEDLAGVAVFLASPASDYVNGHVLVVDGGWMGR
jgi:2-dehydro-3-deoxy-D-gluconate 5-dehydrogenase